MAIHAERIVATLEIIDYEQIRARDPTELSKLLKACQPSPTGSGIFFLDLSGPSGRQTLTKTRSIDRAILSYFHQSKDVKMDDFRDGVERGFKHPGEIIETFEISTDEEVKGTHKLPLKLQECKSEVSSVLTTCDSITRDVLTALCPSSDLAPSGTSDSGLKLYLQDAHVPVWEVTAAPHTDMGLLTLMFYDVACVELAVCADGKTEQQWALVEPVAGCVIVHVGDALQAALDGALHSPLHCVVQPEPVPSGGTCMLVYFLRPAHAGTEQQEAV
ncbi:unnamed protein product [Discula destructiva]